MTASDSERKLRDPDFVSAREAHIARLRAIYAGAWHARPVVVWGISGAAEIDPYSDPEDWVGAALDDLAERAETGKDPIVFRPLVLEFGPFGVHFVDRIFGCQVTWYEDQWWAEPLTSPIGALTPPDLSTNETWLLASRVATAFVARDVTVPLFGLPTIASALNVLLNLYGERAVLAFYADPDSVRHDLRVINDLLCELHVWYQQTIPRGQLQPVVAAQRCQPPGFGQLCGCSTHLISAAMYRDFAAELDDELLSVYEHGGMIHLCGCHTQHIPSWRDMRSLRAIQVNDRAAEDLGIYFWELRDDQVIYLNPTSTMTVERAMAITGGRRLVIAADLPGLPSGVSACPAPSQELRPDSLSHW